VGHANKYGERFSKLRNENRTARECRARRGCIDRVDADLSDVASTPTCIISNDDRMHVQIRLSIGRPETRGKTEVVELSRDQSLARTVLHRRQDNGSGQGQG